jgi:hypothetical protein
LVIILYIYKAQIYYLKTIWGYPLVPMVLCVLAIGLFIISFLQKHYKGIFHKVVFSTAIAMSFVTIVWCLLVIFCWV